MLTYALGFTMLINMKNLNRLALLFLLFAPIVSVYGFYLPGINAAPSGIFYSGYSSSIGGYFGTSFLLRNFIPHTEVSLGFISTLPSRKNIQSLNMGLLGIKTNFELFNGTVEFNLTYQTSFSTDGIFRGDHSPFNGRF